MTELKTIKFPGDAEPRVIVDGAAIHFDQPQRLSPEKKSQARANIGVDAKYYSTTREDLSVTLAKDGATYENVTSDDIWRLYDALAARYPHRVRKNEIHNNDGTFVNYEYVVSTGDYNQVTGDFNAKDDGIKKPKYLVACGIHGWEKPSILSTYRLFRDIVTGHNIPAHFAEGCVIHFLPVGNPWSLDNTKRDNENGVNINRNFAWNWGVGVQDDKKPYIGSKGNSEKETQAIANWLAANTDAQLFLDCHNISPGHNEIVTFVGLTHSEAYNKRKRIAMRGVDRVVPFWKDAMGYAEATIFRNSASINEGGIAAFYASEVLNIPSLSLELSVRPTGTETSSQNLEPETIAVAAEVIGNVLLEFYEQYAMGEVIDMTKTNEKLDGLAEGVTETSGKVDALSASMSGDMAAISQKLDILLGGSAEPTNGFRVETGVYVAQSAYSGRMKIPCSPGAKIFAFIPDDDTQLALANMEENGVFLGYIGQRVAKLTQNLKNVDATGVETPPAFRGHSTMIRYKCISGNSNCPDTKVFALFDNLESTSSNEGGVDENGTPYGFEFGVAKLQPGTYNWTAYYWND